MNRLAAALKPYLSWLIPRRIRQKIYWFLNPPDPRKRIDLVFDVVGNCNLACPSCPVGNTGYVNPSGKMDIQLYERILAKAQTDYVVSHLILYNWGESVLHPELPEFVEIAKKRNLNVLLSTNLNVLRRTKELLLAKPNVIRISLSGFTQEVYGTTHAKGNIETVKANMKQLAKIKKEVGNTETEINVYFHKYKHNLNELQMMKELATELGFSFSETWAYLMPFEKAYDYAEGKMDPIQSEFVEKQFALPIRKAIQEAERYKSDPCALLENQIVLDLKGNLLTCCAVYDYEKNTLGSFLDMSPEQVVQRKTNIETCSKCASHGLHKYFLYEGDPKLGPLFREMAQENSTGAFDIIQPGADKTNEANAW